MQREIYKLDATDKAPGRLATEISMLLQGKNRADWSPEKDNGGIVEVSNVEKIKITGKKLEQYIYYRHSGYPGGLKEKKMKELTPEEIVKHAVWKMIPKNRLRTPRIKRLRFV
ncbi:50S ribosomal protein L13 [Patescibacteria group bacterium]|nr:50S ribosomal protein L13 [Patescibacteria group bacterium]